MTITSFSGGGAGGGTLGISLPAGVSALHDDTDPDAVFHFYGTLDSLEEPFTISRTSFTPTSTLPYCDSSAPGTGSMTIMCLVKPSATASMYACSHGQNSGFMDWTLGSDATGKPRWTGYTNTSLQTITGTTTMSTGTWYHLACVITDNGTTRDITLYVNGTSEGTPITGTAGVSGTYVPNQITLGDYIMTSGTYWQGKVCSLIGINRVLSGTDVTNAKVRCLG